MLIELAKIKTAIVQETFIRLRIRDKTFVWCLEACNLNMLPRYFVEVL